MEIFDRDGKVNFVDENNVVLGYDTEDSCCEIAGWYFVGQEPTTVSPRLHGTGNPPEVPAWREMPDLRGWVFDPGWFKKLPDTVPGVLDEGEAVAFRLVNYDDPSCPLQKFLVLFNAHNDYYHGFTFTQSNEVLQCGDL